jgi:hypothetical protein
MKDVQLVISAIVKVTILKGYNSRVASGPVYLPRVAVNDLYVYEGIEGTLALSELKKVGFYNEMEHAEVNDYLNTLLAPIDNALLI